MTHLTGRGLLRLLVLGATAVVAAVAAAPASAGVTLDWTTANVYAGTERTWLGYVTNPAPGPASAKGSVFPGAGALGPLVTGESPRGANQLVTFGYPATGGELDTDLLSGSMTFQGSVTFESPAPPAGHGFTISVENPRLVLNGDGTGQVFATGLHTVAGAPAPYAETAIFNLDLDGSIAPVYPRATWKLRADGTRMLSGIMASIATAGVPFPGTPPQGYPVGAGPDRTPPTFGTFGIAISPNTGPAGPVGPIGPAGPKGETGPKGSKGVRGKRGKRGKRGRAGKVKRVRLSSAPFKQGVKRQVKVSRNGKVVATGTVSGRALRVTLRGITSLKGTYVLRSGAKAETFTAVRVRVL